MRKYFLIEELKLDPMENKSSAAMFYAPIYITTNEKNAKLFCDKGKIYTNKDCWAICGKINQYRYTKINHLIID